LPVNVQIRVIAALDLMDAIRQLARGMIQEVMNVPDCHALEDVAMKISPNEVGHEISLINTLMIEIVFL
jgi:hypothetical protein